MESNTCPKCRHAFHDSLPFCPNLASDNDCGCTGSGAPVIEEEPVLYDLIVASGEVLDMTPEEASAMWDRVIARVQERADECELVEAAQEKAGRSWVTNHVETTCDCCGRKVPTPYHHHHRDTNRETDYCQECYDKGCDLISCSL